MDSDGLSILLIAPKGGRLESPSAALLRYRIEADSSPERLKQVSTVRDALPVLGSESFDTIIVDLHADSDADSVTELIDVVRSAPESSVTAILSGSASVEQSRAIECGAHEVVCTDEPESLDFRSLLRRAAARKKREALQDGPNQVLDLLARGYPLPTILSALAKDLERQTPGMLCSISLLDEDGKHLILGAAPSVPEDLLRRWERFEIGPDRGACGAAAWLGRQVITPHIAQDSIWASCRGAALDLGLRSCWAQPIFSASGRVLGTLALYGGSIRSPKAGELRTIEKAAAIAGIAVGQRRAEVALRYRFDFEKLIFSISARFISAPSESIDAETLLALESIGRFAGVDRSYIFLLSPDGELMTNTHEWVSPDLRVEQDRLHQIRIEEYPWLKAKLLKHDVIYLKSPDDLPATAEAEREELARRGIRSLIAVPMVQGRRLIGFVGLDSITRTKVWSADAVVLLKMFAQIFANGFDRKRVELELAASQEQFAQNEAQLRLTFNTAQIGMATCTLDGKFLSVNNALCKMLGRDAEELLHLSFADISHPEEGHRIPRRKLLELLRGRVSHIELDKRYLHKNGSTIYATKRIGAIFDSNNSPRYLVAEIEDISEKKKWEAEYLKACKLESLGILAGGIAHDFNNILMAMLGSISFSKLEVPEESPLYERLNDVEKAVYRARDLTHQLLTFAKGGMPIKRTAAIVEILRDTIGFTLAGSDVSYSLQAPDSLWPADVDEGQISQVINNLILNACQAMPDGGHITVLCQNQRVARRSSEYGPPLRPGEYLRISFRDEGAGIPPENLSKIFDPFFTTKDGGSGLGLATTYSIIRRHQGHIEVESAVGQGTEFTIYLPACPRRRAIEKKAARELQLGSGRILLMDDESMVRNVAGHMLSRLGYEVDFAENGVQAVERYQQAQNEGRPFAAVIMDLTVPGGMGGRVAIRKLKKLDPQVRAIVSSGYADGPVMAEFRKYGFCGVMAKPYEMSTLSTVLNAVLSNRPATA
ncbi:MAG: ATP-binding protein [Bdellovibrionota bacterium]